APDTTAALQALAAERRAGWAFPVVGITGSNAKTIIKEWLGRLLAGDFSIVKSPKSYNSQTGVPLSVWQGGPHHNLGVFEAGISRPGEMAKLENVLRPTLGLFTNIGPAHDEGFASRREKIVEKLQLFARCPRLVYCQDQPELADQIVHWANGRAVELLSWGRRPGVALQVREEVRGPGKTGFHLVWRGQPFTLALPATDPATIENALHCVAVMLALGLAPSSLQARLDQVLDTPGHRAVPMRLELKRGIQGCRLVDDSYNNDLAGLGVALAFMAQQTPAGHSRAVVLSDLLQTGLPPGLLYHQVGQLLQAHQVKTLVGIGPEISQASRYFNVPDPHFFPDTPSFLAHLAASANPFFQQATILVKGARHFRFEQITARLQEKIHGTVLEINLDALAHNLAFYRRQVPPGTKLMVMVKAFAYGSGSAEVARLLQNRGADYLAVAYADEGVALRRWGIHLPIMVMNPAPETFASLLEHQLEPEIYSYRLLDQWLAFLRGQTARPPVHLKIDTGMHRLGFLPGELAQLATKLAQAQVPVASVFTHLVGADEARHNEFSERQLQVFSEVANQLEQALGYRPLRHALNSAGILRFPHWQLDMARLGIGLYGVEANGEHQAELQPVGVLKTVISQIKTIPAADSVGYSRRGHLAALDQGLAEGKVGTVAIGYADGYDRRFGNGVGQMWVNGHLASVVGNVCMDMTMIDLTGLPAQEGDEVIVYGGPLPLPQLAARIGTIPYELMTSIGERVKRVFYSG
ncbi:MAG: bifunctional UDP-N-acetylmuramoyl-tripeptide:D-alanyl-D-alanine ligase/alanine racemase, partial [Bernardetiaceae bacterium]|nr:bifunctional UDP-N-acetylmuramoyl-tripeptide:D-alanyl-D-alanine ligase/alanine racemase [Bernardetiaceae bacterium]